MNNFASKSNQNDTPFDDDEIFEDSTFLDNFENSSFKETAGSSKSILNNSLNKSALNVSALCCDEEISGYDKLTGKTWIYPTNYPVRDYQFNIIKASLLSNTLVSLPTGLGKTFIAAVIMYNFYRWYPLGKIVFMAPTKPLVAQQIDACYNIIAIPPTDTIEMTGHMQVNTRKGHWQSKRVIFATPQVIYNDIKSGICPGDKIRCLVLDEAHRARGNYAYCQIVAALSDMEHKTYRVLALSATPGSKVDDVVNVVRNLNIAHLELRTEDCIDVAPYKHVRKINTVVVHLGPELTQLRHQYVEILDSYARRLKQMNILPHNVGNLSKGRIVMLYKEFQNRERGARHPQHNHIMKDFTVLITLYHGLELLLKHGSRVFLNFFDEHPEKSWIQVDEQLMGLLERLRDDLGINPLALNTSVLPDGTIPEIPTNLFFGHPKFYKLKEIMLDHFNRAKQNGQDTKAIVFCEYRESVNLVNCLLLQCRPLIMPQMFVGQGASSKDGKTVVSQKHQLRVMRNFRSGACNALVATCVAEEGLDVGSVDLIICFDISNKSPIRLVQRCGRTGRERGGHVYILVTEGREHQTLLDCMNQRDGLNRKIMQSMEVQNNLYKLNPRMMPHDFTPRCQKMFITVQKREKDVKEKNMETIEKYKKGQRNLRTMLLGRASTSNNITTGRETGEFRPITEEKFNEIFPNGFQPTTHLAVQQEFWSMNRDSFEVVIDGEEKNLKLSTWLEWQRNLHRTMNIGHSSDTETLASLLQYGDAKRFDMPPSTQNPTFNTQDLATQNILRLTSNHVKSPAKINPPKRKPKIPIKSPNKNAGDIRALFSTVTKSTKNYTKAINDLGVNDGSIPTRLVDLFVDLSLNTTNKVEMCYICESICDCELLKKIRACRKKSIKPFMTFQEPKLPDIDLIDDIDTDTILNYIKNNENRELYEDVESCNLNNENNINSNFDLQFDLDALHEVEIRENTSNKDKDKNFDLGDIDDIFADSPEHIEKDVDKSLEIITSKNNMNSPKQVEADIKNTSDPKQALNFFGLESIDDIFADSDESPEDAKNTHENIVNNNNNCDAVVSFENNVANVSKTSIEIDNKEVPMSSEYPTSPSILSGRTAPKMPTSPILSSQVRKFNLTTKKTHPQSSTPINLMKKLEECPSSENKNIHKTHFKETTIDKSMFTITQLVDMINKSNEESLTKSNTSKDISNHQLRENQRCTSPIISTQADKNKSLNSSFSNKTLRSQTSLIILDSDSDSNDTLVYDTETKNNTKGDTTKHTTMENPKSPIKQNKEPLSPVKNKRKLDADENDMTASPYFNKRPKLDNNSNKPLTLQEKIFAVITSNKSDQNYFNDDSTVNFFTCSPFLSQKENINVQMSENANYTKSLEYKPKSNLEMFRRDSTMNSPERKLNILLGSQSISQVTPKRKLTFDDSDDDFVVEDKRDINPKPTCNTNGNMPITNHIVRKKKEKANAFLDLEAELSSEEEDSGDELSDESVGSIIDFICDETVNQSDDMQAHYMRSVKSPVNGVFKIPQLPNKYRNEEVLSQYVEEDNYEMDSFCVDSHIGLTQANDISELELAEMALEERRRENKRKKMSNDSSLSNGDDSPLVRQRKRNVKRLIHSDSDDSS